MLFYAASPKGHSLVIDAISVHWVQAWSVGPCCLRKPKPFRRVVYSRTRILSANQEWFGNLSHGFFERNQAG